MSLPSGWRVVLCLSSMVVISCAISPAQESKSSTHRSEIMGSAFLISREGHVLTCEHCLGPDRDTGEVRVVYDGNVHIAKVILKDPDRDFALLKIDAPVKHFLPICLTVPEQGAEVRALGFPLAFALGDQIKVTRGTIVGKAELSNKRSWLQIDALLNPGNSGGVLVNEAGMVVGITNAGLKREVGQMGFAVPVEDFRTQLDAMKVPYESKPATNKLDGPQLVKQVSPAVLPILRKPAPQNVNQPSRTAPGNAKSQAERRTPGKVERKTTARKSPDMELNTDGLIDVRSSHHTFPSQKPAFGAVFRDVENKDAILIGFTVTTKRGAFNTVINGMQPVYRKDGKEVYGKAYGTHVEISHALVAREGYAVGGVRCESGLWMDAIQLVFMKIDGDHLDPADSYLSPVAGHEPKLSKKLTTTEGHLPVGVHGNVNEKQMLISIGLVVKEKK